MAAQGGRPVVATKGAGVLQCGHERAGDLLQIVSVHRRAQPEAIDTVLGPVEDQLREIVRSADENSCITGEFRVPRVG